MPVLIIILILGLSFTYLFTTHTMTTSYNAAAKQAPAPNGARMCSNQCKTNLANCKKRCDLPEGRWGNAVTFSPRQCLADCTTYLNSCESKCADTFASAQLSGHSSGPTQ